MKRFLSYALMAWVAISTLAFAQSQDSQLEFSASDLTGTFSLSWVGTGGDMPNNGLARVTFDGSESVEGVARMQISWSVTKPSLHVVEGSYFVRPDGTGRMILTLNPKKWWGDTLAIDFIIVGSEHLDLMGTMYTGGTNPEHVNSIEYLHGTGRRQHPRYDTAQLSADELRR